MTRQAAQRGEVPVDHLARRDFLLSAISCLSGVGMVAVLQPFTGMLASLHLPSHALNALLAAALMAPLAAAAYSRRRVRFSRRVHEALSDLSRFDPVTGLLNRRALVDQAVLKRGATPASRPAVVFVDIDGFKLVNDTHGHEAGDLLLAAVGERLRSAVRESDVVVRYGGDEFVVVCMEVSSTRAAQRVAARIASVLEAPVEIGRDRLRVSASVGVALADSGKTSLEEMLARADRAMYQAKQAGPGGWVISTHQEAPPLGEAALERAIEAGQLVLHYQPIRRLADGEIVGAEALLRWEHPEHGELPPTAFVPLLERSGLIVPVGQWVIEQAARQAQEWARRHPHRADLRVSVNVAPRQLNQLGFAQAARAAIECGGVSPRKLCIEITEGALIRDPDAAWSALRQLKALGVQLALDDFGTGYASLAYLRRVNLDLLKIDRTFVAGLGVSGEDTTIVQHVIGLAHALGLVAVAEGVERAEQADELRRLGCDRAQGHLFGPAAPAAELDRALAAPLGGWATARDMVRATTIIGSAPPAVAPTAGGT